MDSIYGILSTHIGIWGVYTLTFLLFQAILRYELAEANQQQRRPVDVMKFTINQNSDIPELEVTINCPYIDDNIRHLIDCIHQFSGTLPGYIDEDFYSIPLNRILYIECTDKKVFFYDEKCIYQSKETISSLEKKLQQIMFIRVSKNFIINLTQLLCLQPGSNHRMEAVMKNGEHIIVSRSYVQAVKEHFSMANENPSISRYAEKNVLPQVEQAHRSVFNMGKILNFYHIPSRVLALSYGEAELLASLGLTNMITAITPAECSIQDVSPQYRDELGKIPLMRNNNIGIPNSASIQELRIDFILGTAFSRFSYKQEFEQASIDSMFYVLESTAHGSSTLESWYHDILNIGRIFHVENRAIAMVENARKKIAALVGSYKGKQVRRVFVYDGGTTAPHTSGQNTLENSLITLSGGQNIFENMDECYFTTSWDAVIAKDPEFIFVHDYSDTISTEDKINYLKNREDLQSITAIKNKRIIPFTLLEVFPSVQLVHTVEKLIRTFHSDIF